MKNLLLNESEKAIIEQKIVQIEAKTSGEIRVAITKSSPRWLYGPSSVKTKARQLFKKYNMHKTIDRTGIIILFSCEERQFYIHADIHIFEKIGQVKLDSFSKDLSQTMREEKYCTGICNILDKLSEPLIQYFPIKEGDVNELSNQVIEV